MRLHDLVAAVEGVGIEGRGAGADPELTAVVQHTGAVVPGALYCCVPGRKVDGHDLAPGAVDAGAVALLCQRHLDLAVPQLLVSDVRRALGPTAAAFWGHPSRHLDVIGVTGTNGKTTVTHLVAAVLQAAGRATEVIGTLSTPRSSGVPTTPEATELQAQLAALRAAGTAAVAMEVSSHALALHRVDATRFAVAAFTNLSPDHLDFHGDLERYFEAKARLFTPDFCDHAVVNTDDAAGRRLADRTRVPVEAYGLADATELETGPSGARFRWRGQPMSLRLGGRFNVVNALAAATIAEHLGVDRPTIAGALAEAPAVPGRFEPVDAGQAAAVVVDYAHTPDALRSALGAARDLTGPGGSVTVVFGCGGDRDAAKRPLMGAVAAELADVVVVTNDNPRTEDPQAIADAIVAGAGPPASDRRAEVLVELDRRAAIHHALRGARQGDVVLIAGKGHETEQIVGDRRLPFDDRQVARQLLGEGGAA